MCSRAVGTVRDDTRDPPLVSQQRDSCPQHQSTSTHCSEETSVPVVPQWPILHSELVHLVEPVHPTPMDTTITQQEPVQQPPLEPLLTSGGAEAPRQLGSDADSKEDSHDSDTREESEKHTSRASLDLPISLFEDIKSYAYLIRKIATKLGL